MYRDCRNLVVTATNPKSVELLDAAVFSYMGARRDVADLAASTVEADPDCVLAHCLNGYLGMHAGKSGGLRNAASSLKQAKRAAENRATPRELAHVAALDSWLAGNFEDALDHWEQVITDHPTDILALRLAQFITSYLGKSAAIRDSVARAIPAWEPSIPGYGFVLGCYAYGLEEAGDYEEAERLGRAAVDYNPADLWAGHAVTHVMEMQGRPREGLAWIDAAKQHWSECGNFARHLWWHGCLFHLTLEEYDRVLGLYDRAVRAESTDEYLDVVNASSLLWRLEQAGIAVGHRWEELASRAADHIDDHLFILADLHYALALAAGSHGDRVRAFMDSCAAFASNAEKTEAQVMKDVGLAIIQGVFAHGRGHFSSAADLLDPIRNLIWRVGGSHAQRDIFTHLLIDAAIRDRRPAQARDLLRERLVKRPRELWSLRQLEAICREIGDSEGSLSARQEIDRLLAVVS